MENIPAYISWGFIFTVAITLFFLFKATRPSVKIAAVVLLWLLLQLYIAGTGFYLTTTTMPPRFLLLIVPPLITIAALLLTSKGKKWIAKLDTKWLTYLHIVRVPVEIILLCLFMYKQIPKLMTFEGSNFDIVSGLTAPLIAYFGYSKKILSTSVLLLWNFICLALLMNIVISAVLSAPFTFQQLAFDQPNVAVLYFPFVLLPGFIVPAVLFAHLVNIRQLLTERQQIKMRT